jgi:polyhydroxyalkanoate synthase
MSLSLPEVAAAYTEELRSFNEKLTRMAGTLLRTQDVDLATSPKTLVHRVDKVSLYRFTPVAAQRCAVPVLITYALVNRETMMDLEAGRSLIRNLLEQGLDLYIINWGSPSRMDQALTLDDYIDMYIDACVRFICRERGLAKINLLGVCQGGTYAAIYTALHPDRIRNLVTMVAPFDWDNRDSLLNIWARQMDAERMVSRLGNIPADLMNFGFLMLKPFQLMLDKYVGMVDLADNPEALRSFLRMEKWIFDSPDLAGQAFLKFIQATYGTNSLARGTLEINGRTVDMKRITHPVLNLFAEQDHLVPPSASRALRHLVGSRDYTERALPVGHIGMYVSSKSQRELGPLIADWLVKRSGRIKTSARVRHRPRVAMAA